MLTLILLIFTLLIPLDNKTSIWLNFGGGMNLTTFFLIILILIWFFKSRSNEHFIVKSPLNLPIFSFMLFMTFSLFTLYFSSGYSLLSTELHFFKRFITTFILFFIILNSVNNKRTMKVITYAIIFMIILIGLFSIKEYRGSYRWHYSDDMRFTLVGMQPNHLGAFFAQYIPLILSFILINKNFKNRIIHLVLFLISLPALMFTYSRGAYLSIIAALLLMGIFGKKKYILGIGLIVIVTVLATSLLFGKGRIIPVSVRERFESLTEEEKDKSIETREAMWAMAKEYISQSPLIGYGYGASRYMLPRDTHNTYLDIALEAGIPALLLLLFIFFKAFKVAFKVFKISDDPFYKAISLGLIGSLSALAVGNYFGTRLNFFASNGYFAILMGMVTRIYTELISNKVTQRVNQQKAKAVKKYKVTAAHTL